MTVMSHHNYRDLLQHIATLAFYSPETLDEAEEVLTAIHSSAMKKKKVHVGEEE